MPAALCFFACAERRSEVGADVLPGVSANPARATLAGNSVPVAVPAKVVGDGDFSPNTSAFVPSRSLFLENSSDER